MRLGMTRNIVGQTPLGLFHNITTPHDCGGVKYVSLHVGRTRLEITFRAWWERA